MSIVLDPPTQVKEAEKEDTFDLYKPATWLDRFRQWLNLTDEVDFQAEETECPLAQFIDYVAGDPEDISVTGYEISWMDERGHHRSETREQWTYTFVSRWDARVSTKMTNDQRRWAAIDVAKEISEMKGGRL